MASVVSIVVWEGVGWEVGFIWPLNEDQLLLAGQHSPCETFNFVLTIDEVLQVEEVERRSGRYSARGPAFAVRDIQLRSDN